MILGAPRRDVAVCASTNDLALAWARDGAPHGALVVADAQTAGRGRHGRTWVSPPGLHLYASLVLRLPRTVPVAPLTLAIGIGLCDAIRTEGVTAAGLKWPNDVLVPGVSHLRKPADPNDRGGVSHLRKVAGVLGETAGEAVVVGIGVNLNGGAPEEVAHRATAIGEELGRWVDRDAFVARLLEMLEAPIARYIAGGVAAIAEAWEARMVTGMIVKTDRGTGRAIGIDPDGALRVEDGEGRVHRVMAGEVEPVA